MTTAYIGLGSNLGDRWAALAAAVRELGPGVSVGPLFETGAVGGPIGQADFLNSVACMETKLSAASLLERLLRIERRLGRVRGEPCGPRTIDLDLLLNEQEIVQSRAIEVPHPRLHERGFVLAPLVELEPDLIHPVLGLTIKVLYAKWVESGSLDRVVRVAGSEWAEGRVDLAGRIG